MPLQPLIHPTFEFRLSLRSLSRLSRLLGISNHLAKRTDRTDRIVHEMRLDIADLHSQMLGELQGFIHQALVGLMRAGDRIDIADLIPAVEVLLRLLIFSLELVMSVPKLLRGGIPVQSGR